MSDDEWADAAIHALLLRCMTRAAEVLVWLDELDGWE
jgi:hypothetical protein